MAMMGLLLGNFSTDVSLCENGELRVGVRRAMRQQANIPSSIISSHSMHIGVLAMAWHAYMTGTFFTVYYKSRTSPAEFIILRTIIGIEDADTKRWAESKWRCLKVRWDENSTIPSPERVSPWKIKPALTTAALNPLPMPRLKRPRSSMVPSFPDSSVLTREGFGAQTNSSHESIKVNLPDQEGKFNFFASNWSVTPSALSLNLLDSIMKAHVQSSDVPYHSRDVRYGGFTEYSLLPGQKPEQHQGNWSREPPLQSYLHIPTQSRGLIPRPILVQQPEAVKPKDGNCRLFGIPLISNHVTTEPAHSHKTTIETDQRSEQRKGVNVVDQPLPSVEQEKPFQMCQPLVRDCLGKVHGGSTWSCTKVHKRGIALGRSVDLTKFSNYEELIAELDQLFEFNGELKARNKNWLIIFTDDEGDMILVGDDPWL
ncbi:unnamed protein product [Camellia sinensis]